MSKHWQKISIISGAVILFILSIFLISPILLVLAIFLTATALFFCKTWPGRILVFLFFLLLIIFLPMEIVSGRSLILSCIYAPPAINSENLIIFNDCVKFAKKYDEFENLVLWNGIISVGDGYHPPEHLIKEKPFFSANEVAEIQRLAKTLSGLRYSKLQRDNNIVLFHKRINRILPTSPTVVYSLDGRNPDQIDSKALNVAKPFTKITGNWYTSRKLMFRGLRPSIPTSTPKALFDRSLCIDGIDPNELHKFD